MFHCEADLLCKAHSAFRFYNCTFLFVVIKLSNCAVQHAMIKVAMVNESAGILDNDLMCAQHSDGLGDREVDVNVARELHIGAKSGEFAVLRH